MRIGVDIDGTLTDLHKEIIKYGLIYNQDISGNGIKNKNAYKILDIFDWSKENCKTFKQYIQREILNKVQPRKGAIKWLQAIKKSGYDIFIVTGRKKEEMNNTYEETLNWLKKNNIPFDNFIVEENNKGMACKKNNIDIFVDDSVKHLDRIYDAGIKNLYIFDNVYNRNTDKYKRIYSFKDLYYNINNQKNK